jgi:hypothetical protein
MELECAICGRDVDVAPPDSCGICYGRAGTAPRARTLSQMRATGDYGDGNRYGGESLNPKSSPLVVGGESFHPGHPGN